MLLQQQNWLQNYLSINLKIKDDNVRSDGIVSGYYCRHEKFHIRTGARTFDLASYLRSHGADTVLVQELLKEDMDRYLRVAKAIRNAYIYKNGIKVDEVMITTISAYCAIGRHVINDDRDYCIICCCETWREPHWN